MYHFLTRKKCGYPPILLDNILLFDMVYTTARHIFSGTTANMLLRITIIRDFANLRNAQVGSYAQISTADGYVATYICTRVCTDGRNTQYDLLDEYGISADSSDNCSLLMYTCNQDWEHITLTFWEKA